jgi:hypothetical protein
MRKQRGEESSKFPIGVGTRNNFIGAKIVCALLFLLLFHSNILNAQEDQPIDKVLHVLSSPATPLPENAIAILESHSWEALAYWDPESEPDITNVYEAVPDVYRFDNGTVKMNLQSQGGQPRTINGLYSLFGSEIQLYKKGGSEIADRWKILYLSAEYLALDLGDIHVFFALPDNDPF